MDILTLKDRIEANEYRSDRHPAVPFVTFADVLNPLRVEPASNYPECGASLTIGEVTHMCTRRFGHVYIGEQHSWAALLNQR